jgi:hypothetical protein
MILKFTPEQLDERTERKEGESPLLGTLFEGFVEVKAPSYPERLRFPKELGLESFGEKSVDEEKERLSKSLNQMETLAKCAEKVMPFIVGVNLKVLIPNTGVDELKSAEDLYDFPQAGAIVTAICSKFLLGFLEKKL